MNKPIKIENMPKPWWAGDDRVERFMPPVSNALDKNKITGNAYTDIYNRAYEAVYNAIKVYGDKEPDKIIGGKL